MSKKDAAIHKRQQIEQSSRVMFLWVAGASVIVGFALVISWFLVQQIIFKERVLGEKNNTAAVLKNNNDAVEKLRGELKVLETNSHLNASRINNDEKALQVVLDALPAEDNALALGASLQSKLVNGVAGVSLDSLNIDQTDDSESSNSTGVAVSNGNLQSIHFTMEVSASNPNALRELLQRFERSIRVIEIDRMTIERTDSKVAMKISAHAYYSPAKTIELKKKDIKP
jgi:hypothetical protein